MGVSAVQRPRYGAGAPRLDHPDRSDLGPEVPDEEGTGAVSGALTSWAPSCHGHMAICDLRPAWL